MNQKLQNLGLASFKFMANSQSGLTTSSSPIMLLCVIHHVIYEVLKAEGTVQCLSLPTTTLHIALIYISKLPQLYIYSLHIAKVKQAGSKFDLLSCTLRVCKTYFFRHITGLNY